MFIEKWGKRGIVNFLFEHISQHIIFIFEWGHARAYTIFCYKCELSIITMNIIKADNNYTINFILSYIQI